MLTRTYIHVYHTIRVSSNENYMYFSVTAASVSAGSASSLGMTAGVAL